MLKDYCRLSACCIAWQLAPTNNILKTWIDHLGMVCPNIEWNLSHHCSEIRWCVETSKTPHFISGRQTPHVGADQDCFSYFFQNKTFLSWSHRAHGIAFTMFCTSKLYLWFKSAKKSGLCEPTTFVMQNFVNTISHYNCLYAHAQWVVASSSFDNCMAKRCIRWVEKPH